MRSSPGVKKLILLRVNTARPGFMTETSFSGVIFEDIGTGTVL
jgi:hypothetical protein